MKKINKSLVYKLCTLCIAFGCIIYYRGPCMLFFGEPDFREE